MYFVYGGKENYDGPSIAYHQINANKSYLRHYENSLYLQFLANNGNMKERRQAANELTICERKMAWAERHPNFVWAAVLPEVEKLKKDWSRKGPKLPT